ncbi:hypothetical protein, partial [Nocardioides sp.]|uniref:hypothetical protein n=1 Tax=Nocardioides sp. TaxID=35761 RepID=UPI001A3334B0
MTPAGVLAVLAAVAAVQVMLAPAQHPGRGSSGGGRGLLVLAAGSGAGLVLVTGRDRLVPVLVVAAASWIGLSL